MRALRRLRGVGLVAGGVALGIAVAVVPGQLSSGDEPLSASRSADVDPATLLDASRLDDVEGDRLRAPTGRAAVEQFLDAVVRRDAGRSFALLADPVRLGYGSSAAWAADPDAVPQVLGYDLEESAADDGGPATVTTLTRYRSSLDSVAGLVPARARTTWAVVQEDAGWAVDLDATAQVPLLPPDDDAVDAVRAWVAQQQRCEPGDRALRGDTAVAGALCQAPGAVQTAGAAEPLSALDAGALGSGFGGDVAGWARSVTVSSPVPLRAVVAPVADRWVVVAALSPPGAGR